MSFRRYLLTPSGERWTGFGEVLSTTAGVVLKMASRRNRYIVHPNTKQESPEGHRGKSLSCGNNYFQSHIPCITSLQFRSPVD
jgi:hypothetical protein